MGGLVVEVEALVVEVEPVTKYFVNVAKIHLAASVVTGREAATMKWGDVGLSAVGVGTSAVKCRT